MYQGTSRIREQGQNPQIPEAARTGHGELFAGLGRRLEDPPDIPASIPLLSVRGLWDRAAMPAPDSQIPFLERRGHVVAILLVLVGLGLRCTPRLGYWFNPDEGINYSLVTHPTFTRCWEELTANSHPFGISVVVWLMGQISFDPTWLRMEALLSGVAAIYLGWRAGRAFGGPVSGLVAAAIIAVSPAAIEQSQVIRPYMMQLAFLAGALWGLSSWLQHRRGLVWFSVFLTLAVVTQFSSFFIAGAIGVWLLGLLFTGHLQRQDLLPLAIAFAGPIAAMTFLYLFHIAPHLLGAEIQEDAKETWLAPFFVTGPPHVWGSLLALQRYLFGAYLAGPMLLVLLAGLGYGLWCRRPVAWLTLIMLLVALGASSVSLYPFGGTRHCVYVLLFQGLVLGDSLTTLSRRGLQPLLWCVGTAAGLLVAGGPVGRVLNNDYTRGRLPGEHVLNSEHWQTVDELLDSLAGTDSLVITNLQTYYTLLPKLNLHLHPEFVVDDLARRSRWGTCRVFATHAWDATIEPASRGTNKHLETFLRALEERYENVDLRKDRRLWIIVAGWATNEVGELVQLQGLVGKELRFILRLTAYPGFAAAEIQTGPFLAAVDRLGR